MCYEIIYVDETDLGASVCCSGVTLPPECSTASFEPGMAQLCVFVTALFDENDH
jgi:hypothetical protein